MLNTSGFKVVMLNLAGSVQTPEDLKAAYDALAYLEQSLGSAALRLHRGGASYAALAAPFGITRQAARKRWAPEPER